MAWRFRYDYLLCLMKDWFFVFKAINICVIERKMPKFFNRKYHEKKNLEHEKKVNWVI